MKWWISWPLVLICFTLQVSFLAALRPFGVVPNLILVALLAVGAWQRASVSVAQAVVVGLLTDLVSGADFGLRTAFFTLAALSLVALRQFGFELERLSLTLTWLVIATLLFNTSILAGVWLRHGLIGWGTALARGLVEALINIILAVLLITLVRWISKGRAGRPHHA